MTDTRLNAAALRNRDSLGLCVGIEHRFKDDGSVDWRAMVKPEFVYPNEAYFTAKQKKVPDSAEGLADHECLVMLAGLKELLSLRGYESVDFELLSEAGAAVTVKATVTFCPNYETNGTKCVRSDIATAGVFNVATSYAAYLHTIAANRALARVIRSFLNIHVVSKEEIGDTTIEEPAKKEGIVTPYSMLSDLIAEKGLTVDEVKEICAANSFESDWTSFGDLKDKGSICRKLLPILRKKV
jgi:hypothetical protein